MANRYRLALHSRDAVDDRGVVERVGDDGIVGAEQGIEHGTVGIEAGGERDGVVVAQPVGQLLFELSMQIKGAADESNRGHAKAVLIHSRPGGGNDVRVIGQAQVVVGAQVHHRALLGVLTDLDFTPLGRNNQAFTLPQPLRFDVVKGVGQAAIKFISAHSNSFAHTETTAVQAGSRNHLFPGLFLR